MSGERIYKIIFFNQGEVYEIYGRQVSQGNLFGFVEIEELRFGRESQVVIDPTQERLEREFEGVRRTHVPVHAIVRIDEVEKPGSSRISTPPEGASGNLRPFPTVVPPGGGKGERR